MFLILKGFNLLQMLLYFALLFNTEKAVVRIRLGRCSKNLPVGLYPAGHPPTRPALSLSLSFYIAQPFSLPPTTHLYTVTHTLSVQLSPSIPELFSHHFLLSLHHSHQKNIPFTSPMKKTYLSQQTLLTSL